MDLYYENSLLEQPQNVELWSAYANSLPDPLNRAKVLARAAAAVPDTTLWLRYVESRVGRQGSTARKALYEALLDAVGLFPDNKQLWKILLGQFPQPSSFDLYLRHGPNPQSIWPEYLKWAESNSHYEIYLRYLEFSRNPVKLAEQLMDKAPHIALKIMTDTPLQSFHDAQVLLQAAETCGDSRCEAFFRSALKLFPENDGWTVPALAVYLAGQGEHSEAQSVLDSGLWEASSVRSFAEIYAAACAFHEAYISSLADAGLSTERALHVYHRLLSRRKLLLNQVCIRIEPNYVGHWLERALFVGSPQQKAAIFDEALEKIDPRRAIGGLHKIWIAYAELFISMTQVRTLFDRAVKVRYRDVKDLGAVWMAWAERELSLDPQRALLVLQKAVKGPTGESHIRFDNTNLSPQERLHKSPKLWNYYLQLVAKYADLDKVREVFAQTLQYKVASANSVVRYANLLADNGFIEECYRVYERSTAQFPFPAAFGLWVAYLDRVSESQLSLERLRDLYEQVLEACPPDQALPFYLRYSQLELDRGLVSNALDILQRGSSQLPAADLPELYGVYLTALKEHRGLAATRPVYESAMQRLGYSDLGIFAREFAEVELELGDLKRARSVLKFAAQFYDPTLPKGTGFWDRWQEIEQEHGDPSSFREMLLVKREVEEAILNDPYRLADREEHIDFVQEVE